MQLCSIKVASLQGVAIQAVTEKVLNRIVHYRVDADVAVVA
jgi:hypothetical protein